MATLSNSVDVNKLIINVVPSAEVYNSMVDNNQVNENELYLVEGSDDNNTTYTFTSGTTGSFTVTPSDGAAQVVSIGVPATAGFASSAGTANNAKNAGTAAFATTAANAGLAGTANYALEAGTADYATKAQQDAGGNVISSTYLKLSGGTLTGNLYLNGAPTTSTQAANKQYVDNAFAANDAMVFKGTLGTGGTYYELPSPHSAGETYRVISAGTYAGKVCEIGDLVICIADGSVDNNDDWTVAQTNIDGAVIGPTSANNGEVAVFADGTGKAIRKGTVAKSTFISGITVSGGATATLGTAFSVPNVTENTIVTSSKITSATHASVVASISQAASTSSVIGSVSNSVLTFSQAITSVGTVSSTPTTATHITYSTVTASYTTLGTAFSIPNFIDVDSSISVTLTTAQAVTSIS